MCSSSLSPGRQLGDNQHYIIAQYSGEMINIILSTLQCKLFADEFISPQFAMYRWPPHADPQSWDCCRIRTRTSAVSPSCTQQCSAVQCSAVQCRWGNLFRFTDLHTALHSFLDTRQDDTTQHVLSAWVSGNYHALLDLILYRLWKYFQVVMTVWLVTACWMLDIWCRFLTQETKASVGFFVGVFN